MGFKNHSLLITAVTAGTIAFSAAAAAQPTHIASAGNGATATTSQNFRNSGPATNAPQSAEISAHNQLIRGENVFNQPSNTVITIDRVHLSQPGDVSIKAANAYGDASAQTLGRVHLTSGDHHNVQIKLDRKRLQQGGYFQAGQEKKAFVTVDGTNLQSNAGAPQSTKSIWLRNPAHDES